MWAADIPALLGGQYIYRGRVQQHSLMCGRYMSHTFVNSLHQQWYMHVHCCFMHAALHACCCFMHAAAASCMLLFMHAAASCMYTAPTLTRWRRVRTYDHGRQPLSYPLLRVVLYNLNMLKVPQLVLVESWTCRISPANSNATFKHLIDLSCDLIVQHINFYCMHNTS